MYTKDKTNRITLRLNDCQFGFVKSNADILGVSPSDFLRMVVNASMATQRNIDERVQSIEKGKGEGRENDKTNLNNLV